MNHWWYLWYDPGGCYNLESLSKTHLKLDWLIDWAQRLSKDRSAWHIRNSSRTQISQSSYIRNIHFCCSIVVTFCTQQGSIQYCNNQQFPQDTGPIYGSSSSLWWSRTPFANMDQCLYFHIRHLSDTFQTWWSRNIFVTFEWELHFIIVSRAVLLKVCVALLLDDTFHNSSHFCNLQINILVT